MSRYYRYYFLLIFSLLSVAVAYAQGDCANSIRVKRHCQNIQVHFKFDKHDLDLDYMGNEASLRKFADKLDSIGISKIDSIVVVSQSSPEGVYLHNLKLSRNRAETMRQYIVSAYPDLSSRLFVHPDGESWVQLREYVRKDTLMKQSTIDKVISVIDADVSVDTKKWRMQQLPIYRYLLLTYYPRIRNSVVCMVYFSEELPRLTTPSFSVEQQAEESTIKLESTIKPTLPTKSVQSKVETSNRKLYLKTNAVGLGLGIANAAIEIDLFRHWSFTFPVFHSNWNYFKSTLKFRTNAVQPEFRYWLSEDNAGFFVGAHFGIAYYNFAFDGDYRYQDHNCKTPSIGGGLSVGYRLPLSRNNRWSVEFSLGAGAYSRHYDKFYNTPNTKDGLMVETVKKTYWGVDQAAVSISYSFDLKKKGGNR